MTPRKSGKMEFPHTCAVTAFQLAQHVTLPSLEEADADIAVQLRVYFHKWPFSQVETRVVHGNTEKYVCKRTQNHP